MTVPENSPSPTDPPTTPAIDGHWVTYFVNVAARWFPPAAALPTPMDAVSNAMVAAARTTRMTPERRRRVSIFGSISNPRVDTRIAVSSSAGWRSGCRRDHGRNCIAADDPWMKGI